MLNDNNINKQQCAKNRLIINLASIKIIHKNNEIMASVTAVLIQVKPSHLPQ